MENTIKLMTDTAKKVEIKFLSRKLERACKEAQALEWAFDQTGRMLENEQSKYLFALKIQAVRKCEDITSKITNLEVELLRSSRNTN